MPITFHPNQIDRDLFEAQHVRRWLELFYDNEYIDFSETKLDRLLQRTEAHPGHADDASLDIQWLLWLECLTLAEEL
jgi:hypothetical protein